MPTKKNYQGNQQNYDPKDGEYESGPRGAFSSFGNPNEDSKGHEVATLGSSNKPFKLDHTTSKDGTNTIHDIGIEFNNGKETKKGHGKAHDFNLSPNKGMGTYNVALADAFENLGVDQGLLEDAYNNSSNLDEFVDYLNKNYKPTENKGITPPNDDLKQKHPFLSDASNVLDKGDDYAIEKFGGNYLVHKGNDINKFDSLEEAKSFAKKGATPKSKYSDEELTDTLKHIIYDYYDNDITTKDKWADHLYRNYRMNDNITDPDEQKALKAQIDKIVGNINSNRDVFYLGANKPSKQDNQPNKMKINAKDYEVFDEMPKDWTEMEGALTAPKGYKWVSNNKSRFGGEHKKGLLKTNDTVFSDKDNTINTLKKYGVDTSKLRTPADVRALERNHPISKFSKQQGDEFFGATGKLRELLQNEQLPRAERDTSKDITPEFDEEVNKYYELNGRKAPNMYGGEPVDNIKKYFKDLATNSGNTIDDDIAMEREEIEELENEYKGKEMHPNLKAFLDKKKDRYNWLSKNRDRLETYYKDIK